MSKPLESLTIFFPFYNDAGTVAKQIEIAYRVGNQFTDDLEVIALHGGNSKDDTWQQILQQKELYPDLVTINKNDNWEGYAVIKYGFQAATKAWTFYTDGDAQYDTESDFPRLVVALESTQADIVNGYKQNRKDNWIRVILGKGYANFSRWLLGLPIRDCDCDFRLMRTQIIQSVELESHNASILPEMLKKWELAGAKFTEVPVAHLNRQYGQSNYTPFSLFKEKLLGDIKLFWKMRKYGK